jgi:hypothetical protein
MNVEMKKTVSSKKYLVCSDRSNVLPWCLYNVQQTTSLMKIPEKNMEGTKEKEGDVRDMSSFPPIQLQSNDTLKRSEVATVLSPNF